MTKDQGPIESGSREDADPELRALDEAVRLEELRLSLHATFDTRTLSALKAQRRNLAAVRDQSPHR